MQCIFLKYNLTFSSVYEDVPKAFERWKNDGKKIYIYSSGSVEAQILLFTYSEAGDLTKVIINLTVSI